MASQDQNKLKFPSLLDALYCDEEEQWGGADREDCYTNEEEESSECVNGSVDPEPPLLLEEEWLWGEEELCSLLNKEGENDLWNGMERDRSLAEDRTKAVEWMLRVIDFYSFSAKTALLAVNYLDRFLFTFESHDENKPWMTQLAAVTCLSLAAKVEETQVPLLLDFQV